MPRPWCTGVIFLAACRAAAVSQASAPAAVVPVEATAASAGEQPTAQPSVAAAVAAGSSTVAPAEPPERTAADEDCADDQLCALSGYCWAQGEACVARYPDDCKSSLNCAVDGRCTLLVNRCIATLADCRAHDNCTVNGLCTSVGGRCTVIAADECRGSEGCVLRGECNYHPPTQHTMPRCGR